MSERRKFPRVLVRVLVDFESPDTYLYDYSNDLSEGGIFIETENPMPIGTPLTLRFTLPGLDRVFEGKGKVAWLNEGRTATAIKNSFARGMGVEISAMDDEDRRLVKEYIAKKVDTKI